MHSIFYKYICKYGVSCIILAKILREFEISFYEIYIYIHTVRACRALLYNYKLISKYNLP